MNRSELAQLLGAPTGLVAEPRAGATVIRSGEPRRFMTEFALAVAQGGVVLLASDTWGENEDRQLAALRQQEQNTPATAAGKGWLCIPTGGTSGQLKFARHDEETLAAAVRGFARHFGGCAVP
jgi:O-succinylbenzoic acid--CoA ligase